MNEWCFFKSKGATQAIFLILDFKLKETRTQEIGENPPGIPGSTDRNNNEKPLNKRLLISQGLEFPFDISDRRQTIFAGLPDFRSEWTEAGYRKHPDAIAPIH